MATNTPNLNLVKPAMDDYADIRVLNGNMDILDKADDDIKKQIKAMLGEEAWNSVPADTIKHIVALLGTGGTAEYSYHPSGDLPYWCIKFVNGFMLQYGEVTADGDADCIVTFPIPFNKLQAFFCIDYTGEDPISFDYFSTRKERCTNTTGWARAKTYKSGNWAVWIALGNWKEV